VNSNQPNGRRDMVVAGGSAGALQVLQAMLGGLPAKCGGSIWIAVHASVHAPALLDVICDEAV
jgi:hypothetical protein